MTMSHVDFKKCPCRPVEFLNFKDRQHWSKGGIGISFITHKVEGSEDRVLSSKSLISALSIDTV